MPNIKPASMQSGHISNEEREARELAEANLKGTTEITVKAPKELTKNGKKLYKNIIALLPIGFLNGGDTFVVGIVAESLDRMQSCQLQINENGLFTEDGNENSAVKTYDKYSKIFEKFSGKIGLSPKDRASLAVLMLNDKEDSEDPVAKAMRGE